MKSENSYDITIFPIEGRDEWKVSVTYYFSNRSPEKKVVSSTTYVWLTSCKEIIDWFQARRTKVFYSQLRVLCRRYGGKERSYFKAK